MKIETLSKTETAFNCPRGYGECEDAHACVYPGRCGARFDELWEQYQHEMANGYGFGHTSEWNKPPIPGFGNGRNFAAFCAKKSP